MIKKFKEYFKEDNHDDKNAKSIPKIESILSNEELEDQFLRLKEVLYCNFVYDLHQNMYVIDIYPTSLYNKKIKEFESTNIENISNEINDVEFRLKNMFPSLKIESNKRNNGIGTIYFNFLIELK